MTWLLNLFGSWPGAIAQGMIWGLMAIGVYITYKILDFADLTVDGSICTGAAVCAMLMLRGANVWVAMLAALVAGMLAGLVTGIFHTVMGIPPILSGILTQLILWSVNLKILGRANQALPAQSFHVLIAQLHPKWKTILILAGFCAAIIALLYWFFGTELGSAIRATGCNPNMSRAQGINTSMNKLLALMISNGLVGLSGALLAQYGGFTDISMGRGAIVIGLAAVIIGEAVISRISQNFVVRLTGVVAGGVIYYLVYQTVIFIGLDTDLLKMLSALVVAVFLALPYLKKTYFAKSAKKATVGCPECVRNDDAPETEKEDDHAGT